MAYLLSLLSALACPILMGLMFWLMMRRPKDQPARDAHQANLDAHSAPGGVARTNPTGGLRLCLNWKVVAGLAVVGLGVWVITPNLVWAALPILIVLACPLSMLLMMRGMSAGQCAVQSQHEGHSTSGDRTHAEQLAALRAQQASIAREIAEMEATQRTTARERDLDTSLANVPVEGQR